MKTDRDPEAEAEDKVEEEKLPGVEEEGPVAIESGFPTAGGDWDAAQPAGFTGTQAAATNWDGAEGDWAAAGAAGASADWAGEATAAAPKDSQW